MPIFWDFCNSEKLRLFPVFIIERMPRLTQKQIAFMERKERAKQLLKRAMRLPEDKNPEMQNVQRLISLLAQPEYGRDYDENDAVELVLQKRNERKRMTKKGQKKINLPVRNGPYQTRSRTRATMAPPTIGMAPPRNNNLAAEFRSYYGIPKTGKKMKTNYTPAIPEHLANLSQQNRMNFYKDLAETAYTERYGKKPSAAMVTLMAKLQNQGKNDDEIYSILENKYKSIGRTMKKNKAPILPAPATTYMNNVRPVPSAPPMNAFPPTPAPYTQQIYTPARTTQTLRHASRFAQKKMTACELCEFEKQGRLSQQDKEAIAQIGEQIQARRNGVAPNPFTGV